MYGGVDFLSASANPISSTTNYTYNNLNQLTAAGNITYTYDGNGNLASQTVNGQTTQFAYTFDNRLKQITYPNGSTNTFQYNADGQRTQRVDSTGTTKFFYDGQRLIAETDANNNTIAVYRYFFALQSMERGTTKRYFLFDGQGSTRQLLDASQNVTDTYAYDAFGNAVSASGTTTNPMRYVGNLIYHTDSDSGLQLLGLRYYDASVGRFLTTDPAQAERNTYLYARANPVNRVDPGGT